MSTYAPVFVSDRPSDAPTDSAWRSAPLNPPNEPLVASSPLATATAVSALLLAEQHDISFSQLQAWTDKKAPAFDTAYQVDLSELIVTSLHWLAQHQNSDGGWGDGDTSELSTTMLVRAAFQLTGVPVKYADLVQRADIYIQSQGGISALPAKCGRDKAQVASILANCAMAGSLSWNRVPTVPFERACLPPTWSRRLGISVERFASPSASAVGLAKFHHTPPRNPLLRLARRWASGPALAHLRQSQSASGGYVDSVPVTSFVVMSLASMGYAHLPLVRRGVEFLFASLRPDGSWPSVNHKDTKVTK